MPDTSKTVYHNYYEITLLQQRIMHLIDDWCHVEKTPIPQRKVLDGMEKQGDKDCTVVNSLNGLLRLGYIRRAIIYSNKIINNETSTRKKKRQRGNNTYYVMLRRI